MPTNNTTYIINTVELPASGIQNGLDPALVSGAPGTATAGQWCDSPYELWPNPPGTLLHSFPDRPTAERTACKAGTAIIDSVAPSTLGHLATTPVTIRGSRFTPASTVAFGATAATNVVVVNSSTITCTAPTQTAAGAQNVVVTNAQGAGVPYSVTYT